MPSCSLFLPAYLCCSSANHLIMFAAFLDQQDDVRDVFFKLMSGVLSRLVYSFLGNASLSLAKKYANTLQFTSFYINTMLGL